MKTVKIKTVSRKFFHQWLEVLTPLHKLGSPQKKAFGELLYYNYIFSLENLNTEMHGILLFDYTVRQKIADTLGMPRKRIDKLIANLKAAGMINKDKSLNKSYVPSMKKNTKSYTLTYEFIFEDDEKRNNKTESNKETKENSK